MTREQMLFLKDACDYCGIDCRTRDAYSGRGMYGRETCAVVVRHPLDLLSAVVGYLKDAHVELPREALREIPQFDDLAQDGMGRDVVVY